MPKKTDTVSRFELDDEVLEIDVADLTFGEMEEVEGYFDRGMGEIDWDSGRALLLVAYLAKKRKHPQTTLDDLRDLKISSLQKAKPKRPTKTPAASGTQD